MKKWSQFASQIIFVEFLLAPPAFAQENEPAPVPDGEGTTPAEPEIPAGQEVEINEDNYRQFMELKDPMRQRDIIPENVFKPGSGLQKLDKLPEESQKHLRNQLREIIVQGDPWQPGDDQSEYPYTPSVAASTDPSLEKQEREAWGELVGSYHEREAQIYENSSGLQAAMGSEQGSNNAGNGPGTSGETGQSGEGNQGQQAGQEGNPDQSDTEGTYSLNGSTDSSANSTAGVSQNAMEFLQGLGKGGSGTREGSSGDALESGNQGESPTSSETQSQGQTGQHGSSEPANAMSGNSPNPPRDPNAGSTAGASQNAMEFLKGNTGQGKNAGSGGTESSAASGEQSGSQSDQSGGEESSKQQTDQNEGQQDSQAGSQNSDQEDGQDTGQNDEQAGGQDTGQGIEKEDGQNQDGQGQDGQRTETTEASKDSTSSASDSPVSPSEPEEESTAGASQNALDYLTRDTGPSGDDSGTVQDTDQAEGTLSLQDLLNARGVGDTTAENPLSTSPDDEPQADKAKPEKDGDG